MAHANAQEAPKWSAILEVRDPDGTRTRHPFRHPRTAVGRRRDNDLALSDEGVSHRHCEFVSEQGYFMVRDLGSQNGTWVNEKRVGEARLRDGDEVRIGGTRIRVALQGKVRRPAARRGGKPLLIAALLALAVAAAWWRIAAREADLRGRYAVLLRELAGSDPCATPAFQDLAAVDARIGGRSFALSLDKGQVRLSKPEEALDLELQSLYLRKRELFDEALRSLTLAQQTRRESAERLSRAGQRLWTGRDRKTAIWADGLLQDRLLAGDELIQSVQQLDDDTRALTGTIAAVLVQKSPQLAEQLARFRFRADLRAATGACRAKSERDGAGLASALNALEE
jgi:hypothetical protein